MTTVRQRLETDEEALLIADEAPQHSDDEPLKLLRIHDCKIPKKTTHAYQPADQFILTMVKARVGRGWDAWVEDIFARKSNDTAVAEMSVSHMPTLRKREYALLAGAIKDLPVDSIVRS